MKTCSICGNPVVAKGLCENHYRLALRKKRNPDKTCYLTLPQILDKYSKHIEESGCILWTKSTTYGYGQITYKKKKYRTHRLAYEFAYGPIPKGLLVCHRCDNRACNNPAHLFLGTYADNTHDMVAKERNRKGENHQNAHLTESDIRAIRLDSRTQREIAQDYGVQQTTIHKIKSGKLWGHVT